MARKKDKINNLLEKQLQKTFFQVLADFRHREDVEEFLGDFMTEGEIQTFSKRMAVCYWLKKGRSYVNIKDNIKVSSATIASVSDMLPRKGVQEALRRIEADEWANIWADKIRRAKMVKSIGNLGGLLNKPS